MEGETGIAARYLTSKFHEDLTDAFAESPEATNPRDVETVKGGSSPCRDERKRGTSLAVAKDNLPVLVTLGAVPSPSGGVPSPHPMRRGGTSMRIQLPFLPALLSGALLSCLTGCPNSGPSVRQGGTTPGPVAAGQASQAGTARSIPYGAPAFQYPAPLPRTWRTVTVDALAYARGRISGVTVPTRIMVGPNDTGEPMVAIAGDMSGGLGGMWRAATWMAAYQASGAVGRDLGHYSIQLVGKGMIDGPSAGALMTAAMMAAMMNVPGRSDVTMAGTVNPDGTVGPVGGIPNKFRAAIKAGKKLLGYPVGQRFSREHGTNRIVDLQEMAKAAGCQAVEVSTIYQAFELLTGRHFPQPAPVNTQAMGLPRDTFAQLKKSIVPWFNTFKSALKRAQSLVGAKSPQAQHRINVALQYMKAANQLFGEGGMAAAYDFASRGGAWAYTSLWYTRLLSLAFKGDLKAIFQATDEMKKSEAAVLTRLQKLRRYRPVNTGDLIALVTGYEQLIEGWAYAEHGNILLKIGIARLKAWARSRNRPDPRPLIFQSFNATVFQYAMAQVKQAKASDFVRLRSASAPGAPVDYAKLRRAAKMYQAIAQANYNYFDQIFVPMISKATGTSMDRVKNMLMATVGKYLLAAYCMRFPKYILARQWGQNSIPTAVAQVAGAMASYFNSAMLVAKYYSLQLPLAKKVQGRLGNYQTIPRLKALVAMLSHAERTARINAALAQKATGSIPVAARVFYQIGMTMKELQAPLKVKALEMFWRSSMVSRLAVMVAGARSSQSMRGMAPAGSSIPVQ